MKIVYKKDSRNPNPEWTVTLVQCKPEKGGWPRGAVAKSSEIATIYGPESKKDEQPYLVDIMNWPTVLEGDIDLKDYYFDTLAEAKAHIEFKCFELLSKHFAGDRRIPVAKEA